MKCVETYVLLAVLCPIKSNATSVSTFDYQSAAWYQISRHPVRQSVYLDVPQGGEEEHVPSRCQGLSLDMRGQERWKENRLESHCTKCRGIGLEIKSNIFLWNHGCLKIVYLLLCQARTIAVAYYFIREFIPNPTFPVILLTLNLVPRAS